MVFRMRPDRSGMCSNEVAIPYIELQPYMTPKGKAAAERLLGAKP